ncbi:hypothetical protein [Actinokineospora sp. HUAS TT18]|uniref:hypothetical protein n=1 Tax=Actinokineospora sp. HUAS TT18 TaxID=3447451 RepID=UPI003F526CF5
MPTPPSRRRPVTPPTTPVRRPRVAGLHRPGAAEPVDRPEPVEPVEAVEPAESTTTDEASAELSTTPANDPQPSGDLTAEAPSPIDWPGAVPPERVGAARGEDGGEEVVSEPDLGVDEPAEEPVPVPSPRPAGKRRAAGRSVPVDLTEAEQQSGVRVLPVEERSDEEIAAAERNKSINFAIVLGVVALVLAGLAIWFRGQADSLTGGTDGGNLSLVDSAATSEVKGKMTVAIEKTLSYNFTELDTTAKAVKEYLAGTAVCEYDKLFGVLKEQAPAQKLILTTKVRDLGVTRLEQDKADMLVFVDQSTTRTEQNQTTASGAQFGIRAEKVDGVWKITDFDMLDQPLPDGKAAPTC